MSMGLHEWLGPIRVRGGIGSETPLGSGMKYLRIFTIALATAGLCTSQAMATTEGWLSDYDAALKQAGEKKLDIFMNFTGSDW